MDLRYERFVVVRLRHDWYRDGVCTGLGVTPTPATVAVLAAHRLRLLPCPDGFTLVGPVEPERDGVVQARFPLEQGVRLVFAVRPVDPAFSNFTDLPDEAGPFRWLLRNQPGSRALHKGAAVGAEDRVRLVARYVSTKAPRAAIGGLITVLDESGVVWASTRVPDFDGEALELGLSLGDHRGIAWLRMLGRPDERLYVDPELHALGPVGVMELRPSAAGWPSWRTVEGRRELKQREFVTRFRARSVVWRYHVVLPASWSGAGTLSIDYPEDPPSPYPPKADIAFKPMSFPEVVARFPGRTVASFESSRPLPLSEVALRNACLTASHLGPLLPHLPGASCHALARAGSSSASFASDIFIAL